jgi:solute:Na+ symporter, SSS family
VNTAPAGLKALVLAAVILASIDSPLASLSSSFVTDIYRPLLKKNADERHYLLVSRVGVIVAGVVLALIAYSCQGVKSILWFAFQVVSVTGGATLGVFLLGLLTRRKGTWGNVAAMVVSTLGMGVLLILNEGQITHLAWSWLLVLGTIVTFTVGYVLGRK